MKKKKLWYEKLSRTVAPYVWFLCPVCKATVVDQVMLSPLSFPQTFPLHCSVCKRSFENNEVHVVAVGGTLNMVKGGPLYDSGAVDDFKAFLQRYNLEGKPEKPLNHFCPYCGHKIT